MTSRKPPRTTSYTGRFGNRWLAAAGTLSLVLALIAGCAGSPSYREVEVPEQTMKAYLHDKPPQLRPLYEKVLREGQRNLVLNHVQAGLAAMELGEFELAEDSFDVALGGIESVYADNEAAAKARSLWYEEGMKDFKGEPYERAMAYYYRGLLYLRRADFENARACFKSGVLQDAFAEEDQHRCDFALLIFLEGWASQCLADNQLTDAAYKEVQRLRPDFVAPSWNHNALLIAETGTSPRKVADGVGHYELKFRRGKGFSEQRTHISLGNHSYNAYPIEDIAWQAMTRGGRPVDKILKGQVVFRQTHEKMGTVLTNVSENAMIAAPLFNDSAGDVQAVSGALGLIGVTQMAIAARARPHADTRYWANLPDAVHVVTCALPPREQTVEASFTDSAGNDIPGLTKKQIVDFADGQHGFSWLRSRPAALPE